ncbi:MAG: HupE/UreJ family protein [Acidobacteria bacterium]|nr:HupE/UreJ family protein [Acidobacteriota bacterium]
MISRGLSTTCRAAAACVVVVAALALPASALGHELDPGFLQVTESEPGVYAITFKVPTAGGRRMPLQPMFPVGCSETSPMTSRPSGTGFLERWQISCDGSLLGETIRIGGLERTYTDVMIRVELAEEEPLSYIVQSVDPSVIVGGEGQGSQGALAYAWLGFEHILLGIDHLLFVLGLLLIVQNRWMLVKTVTSFTVAHSITLAIATLGFASAPAAPLNAAIALSILFLGPEIVRVWRGETSLTIQHPWVVAFAFGLLHGFGFASGLTTIGLPSGEIPLALLLFNVGVELGQLVFVVVILALERAFRVLEIYWPRWAEMFPGYAVGSLGAFWTIQRTWMLLGG